MKAILPAIFVILVVTPWLLPAPSPAVPSPADAPPVERIQPAVLTPVTVPCDAQASQMKPAPTPQPVLEPAETFGPVRINPAIIESAKPKPVVQVPYDGELSPGKQWRWSKKEWRWVHGHWGYQKICQGDGHCIDQRVWIPTPPPTPTKRLIPTLADAVPLRTRTVVEGPQRSVVAVRKSMAPGVLGRATFRPQPRFR
jgi:hypothetical protein